MKKIFYEKMYTFQMNGFALLGLSTLVIYGIVSFVKDWFTLIW